MSKTDLVDDKASSQVGELAAYRAAADKASAALTKALGDSIDAGCPLSDEEIVAVIKAIPPNPAMIHRRKKEGPAWMLKPGEWDMEFDEEAWNREWAPFEASINRLSGDEWKLF